jgi:ribose transport system permease protein
MSGVSGISLKDNLLSVLKSSTVIVGLVLALFCVIATVFSPYFFTLYNLQALARDIAFIGMVAVGQSLLLLLGELDLSVGAMATLSGVFGGLLMTRAGADPYLSFVTGLLAGILLGSLNGTIVSMLKLNAMVTTIGMQGVYVGITFVITKGKAVTGIPETIFFLGKGDLGHVPIPFIFSIIIVVLAFIFATKTKTGRYIYAIGNSKSAASILGIRVNRVRILTFGIVGFLSSLAGMLYVARLGSAQAAIGSNWAMNSIAASVIGGVLLTGGVGNPIGAFLGAAIICVISNVIVLFGVNIYWQNAVIGIVVVVAIALPSLLSLVQERKRLKPSKTV